MAAVLTALCAAQDVASDTSASAPTVPASLPRPTVIVLSWDGLRHDALEFGDFPNLQRLAASGLRARLQPVMPSKTFPGHVSLATGVLPHVHGIIDNHFYDRAAGWYHMSAETRWLEAEPLWVTAERQGVRAATFFWVGSEADWRGQRASYRRAPFDAQIAEHDKVDQIARWLALPAAERPRLIMSYWRGADSAGHRYGPESRQVQRAIAEQDAQLGRLLSVIDALDAAAGPEAYARWATTSLLLVSDHGMTEAGEYLPVREALSAVGIDAVLSGSTLAHVFLADPTEAARALAVIAAVDPRIAVYTAAEAPAAWHLGHPQRTGDLVLSVPPPLVVQMSTGVEGWLTRTAWALGWRFGGHGYDPQHPDMGALLLAMGRGFGDRTTLPEPVSLLQVAPTVARLLAIDPPPLAAAPPLPLSLAD